MTPVSSDDGAVDFPKLSALSMVAQPHQTELAERLEQPDVDGQLAFHGMGSGKCVVGSTVVLTSRGATPIGRLFPATLPDGETTLDGDGLSVWTLRGFKPLRGRFTQTLEEPLVTIQTKRGNSICGTKAHKLRVVRDGVLTWVPAAAIVVGDHLAIASSWGRGALLNSGLEFEPVTEVTVTDFVGRVYDLDVDTECYDDQHYITAGGIIAHNTLSALNAAHRAQLPFTAIVPASLRNNVHKEIAKSNFTLSHEVLSYQEAMKKLKDPAFLDRASRSLVAIDEGHLTAGEGSARRDLLKFLPSKKKLILTGTPIRNHPSEVAPIINSVKPGALPEDPRLFEHQYIDRDADGVARPKNLRDFAGAVYGTTHHYQSNDPANFPTTSETTVHVPMSDRQQAAYNFVTGQYPALAYKLRHGLPADVDQDGDFQAFLSGPRQVTNHPGGFHADATDDDATKIQAAADQMHQRFLTDKNYRGVGYSSFIHAGVNPLSRALTARGIPHGIFTGEQNDAERKAVVDDYNEGRKPVLLLSGAGAAGLDLKGTKHIAVLEPHWNEELINQVKGRGVRYKSHSHLPPEERHVEIQRFQSTHQPTWWEKLLGRRTGSGLTADGYLREGAEAKRKLNEPFLRVLRGEDPSKVEAEYKTASFAGARPAVLFDLDGTIVNKQGLLPGRLDVLRMLKLKGYALVAVTNRSCWTAQITLADLYHGLQEVDFLTEGLLEDIVFCPLPNEAIQKPSPTMLNWAIRQYDLDPDNVCYVGNADEDLEAATAAGIPFHLTDSFFVDFARIANVPEAAAASAKPLPEYGWRRDGDDFVGFLPAASAEQAESITADCDKPAVTIKATNADTVIAITKSAAVAAELDQHYLTTYPGATMRWQIEYSNGV